MDFDAISRVLDNDIENLGVAIARPVPQSEQFHTGIVYRDSNDQIMLLHLAWHYKLCNQPLPAEYLAFNSVLDELNQIHLAAFCQTVAEQNPKGIPYGICIDGTGFSESGKFTLIEDFAGLTCATFVLQIFHSQGYILIDLDNWKIRDSDTQWQQQIIQKLETYLAGIDKKDELLEYQNRKISEGASRFRPEEICAAVVLPNPPHNCDSLEEMASQIVSSLTCHIESLAI